MWGPTCLLPQKGKLITPVHLFVCPGPVEYKQCQGARLTDKESPEAVQGTSCECIVERVYMHILEGGRGLTSVELLWEQEMVATLNYLSASSPDVWSPTNDERNGEGRKVMRDDPST